MKDLKKAVLFVVAAVAAVVYLSAVSPLGAQPPANGEPKDTVTLDKYKDKKTPVTFNHKRHSTDYKCEQCHHKAAPDGNKNPTCGTCHKAEKVDKTPSLKDAFHDQCQGCHKEKAKADPTMKDKAPTTCAKCHK